MNKDMRIICDDKNPMMLFVDFYDDNIDVTVTMTIVVMMMMKLMLGTMTNDE